MQSKLLDFKSENNGTENTTQDEDKLFASKNLLKSQVCELLNQSQPVVCYTLQKNI